MASNHSQSGNGGVETAKGEQYKRSERLQPVKRRSWLDRVLLLLLGSLGLGAATLAGFFGAYHWRLDQLVNFRMHYLVATVVLLVGLLLLRCWRLAIVPGIWLVVNAVVILPLYWPPADYTAADPSHTLRLLSFNVRYDNTHHDEVLDYINASGADVVFVLEVTPELQEAIERYSDEPAWRYRISVVQNETGAFGIAMLVAKSPRDDIRVENARIIDVTPRQPELPSIQTDVTFGGRTATILATHPFPPVSFQAAHHHDEQLAYAKNWMKQQTVPAILIGDLNATPWSASFRDLLNDSRLVNSQAGHGYASTWPAERRIPLGIPIDHCLHDAALVTVERKIGPSLGSDHRALWVTLAWRK